MTPIDRQRPHRQEALAVACAARLRCCLVGSSTPAGSPMSPRRNSGRFAIAAFARRRFEMVTHTPQGIPGDPINVGLVGSRKGARPCLRRGRLGHRRRRHAEDRDRDRRKRAVRPSLSRRAGQPAAVRRPRPGSRLRKAGRRQRRPAPSCPLLAAPMRPATTAARSGWARPASTAASVSATTPAQITHHIGPDIDAERDFADRTT